MSLLSGPTCSLFIFVRPHVRCSVAFEMTGSAYARDRGGRWSVERPSVQGRRTRHQPSTRTCHRGRLLEDRSNHPTQILSGVCRFDLLSDEGQGHRCL